MPSAENVHVDRRLSNFAAGYLESDADLRWAREAFPIVPVQEQTGLYPIYGSESLRVRRADIGPLVNPWPEVDWEMSDGSYFCRGRGLSHPVADAAEPGVREAEERRAVKLLTLQLGRIYAAELIAWIVANLTSAGNGVNLSSDSTDDVLDWAMSEVDGIRSAGAGTQVSCVMGFQALRQLARVSSVRDDIKYTAAALDAGLGGGDAVRSLAAKVRSYLPFDNIYIADTLQNTANEGAAASIADVWTSTSILTYRRGNVSGVDAAGRPYLEEGDPTAMMIPSWTFAGQPAAGMTAAPGLGSARVRDELTGHGATHIRVFAYYGFVETWAAAARMCTATLT